MVSSTDASMLYRCKLQTALERSSLTLIDPDSILFIKRLVVWIVTNILLEPQLSLGQMGMAREMANVQAHLEASLRQLYPVSIGLRLPELLRRAKSVPPNKI